MEVDNLATQSFKCFYPFYNHANIEIIRYSGNHKRVLILNVKKYKQNLVRLSIQRIYMTFCYLYGQLYISIHYTFYWMILQPQDIFSTVTLYGVLIPNVYQHYVANSVIIVSRNIIIEYDVFQNSLRK